MMVIDVGELTDRADEPGSGANDSVRKNAYAPSARTRQSSTPSDSRNWRAVIPSVDAHRTAATGALATSPMICASSVGRDHIGQWLVGRSTQVAFRSSGMPARNDITGSCFA